jgi:hypothetical protein
MKFIIVSLCSVWLFCDSATAQEAVPQIPTPLRRRVLNAETAPSLAENYVVTLTVTEKGQPASELSLVVSSADFKTDFADSKFNVSTFVGTLTPEEGDAVSIRYVLGTQLTVPVEGSTSVQYKNLSVQASVRLKLGDPVQIYKSDTRVCTLRVERLSQQQAKGK